MMGRKNFSGSLDALLGLTSAKDDIEESLHVKLETVQKKNEKSKTSKISKKNITTTAKIGTLEGETRFTTIIKDKHLVKIRALAYWDRMQIKDLLMDALEAYFSQRGSKHVNQAISAYENSSKKKSS